MDNIIKVTGQQQERIKLPMCGKDREGNLYEVDNLSLLKNGKRFLPVMGEFHYSRYEPADWEEEILKMKAGGIRIVAAYVFWIHHEERKGEWDFTGCRDLRGFLDVCGKNGMQVWLRIGPWAHGECRNGGFPDWLVKECADRLRSNDPVYLQEVRRFYQKIGEQAAGRMAKDGGPIIGIQLENEYGHCGGGPSSVAECMAHMRTLKKMALDASLETPYYTSTGWGGGIVVDGETLPVLGGYVDAPWAEHVEEMPASTNFIFSFYKQDENIGSDLKSQESMQMRLQQELQSFTFSIYKNPYLTAELGAGLQVTSHRRTCPYPEDIEAQALCMLGSGANLLGYYMYHGGINPEGKDTTLQESRATGYNNDLPVKSYDFQTCIRESGEVKESYGRLRRLHLFLEDFGEVLAGSDTFFPEKQPESPEDMYTLRTTARINQETGTGFLFINNHQRKRVMEEHVNAAVKLELPEGELLLDSLYIKSGACGIIPFALPCGSGFLEKTNAFLLCRLGSRYFFYTDGEPVYQWRGQEGEVVTLTSDQACRACRLGDTLYILEHADSCLIEKEGRVCLLSVHEEEKVLCYKSTGEPEVKVLRADPVKVPVEMKALEGSGREGEQKEYCEYQIQLGAVPVDNIHQLYLEADYAGDRAEVYLDGKLADDWFTTGEKWHIAMKRFGYPSELVIRVYSSDCPIPNPYGNQVYYDLPVEKGCALKGVKAVPEYSLNVL